MENPYKVLGIDSNASDEMVKEAYLNLQKKYHPDNYEEGSLKDLARKKTEEITDAFDRIMNERRKNRAESGQSGVVVTQDGKEEKNYKNVNGYPEIREMIQEDRLLEAEELLDGVALDNRTAEWYFLKGSIFFSKGFLEDAENYFSTALRMDPDNNEYRAALNRMSWQKQGNFGSPGKGGYNMPNAPVGGCSACDVCSGLMCADCCCECCGGDCVRGC